MLGLGLEDGHARVCAHPQAGRRVSVRVRDCVCAPQCERRPQRLRVRVRVRVGVSPERVWRSSPKTYQTPPAPAGGRSGERGSGECGWRVASVGGWRARGGWAGGGGYGPSTAARTAGNEQARRNGEARTWAVGGLVSCAAKGSRQRPPRGRGHAPQAFSQARRRATLTGQVRKN